MADTDDVSGRNCAAGEQDRDADRVADDRGTVQRRRMRSGGAHLRRGRQHRDVVGAGRVQHEARTPLGRPAGLHTRTTSTC